jgi:hypothetical protein
MHQQKNFRKLATFFRPLLPIENGVRAYDLFALTVIFMIIGHADSYLGGNNIWWRVPDRIVIPVFLISIGYNSAQKTNRILLVGAIVMTFSNWLLKGWIRLDILAMIILLRYIIDPVMEWALKSKARFYGLNLLLLASYPLTNPYGEYGTLSLLMAMAGWINRNRSEVPPDIIKPYQHFIFSYICLLACTAIDPTFRLSVMQFFVIAAGMAWVMYLLYNFRQLLLNSIAARPKDRIEKLCSFIGHKSLEIYMINSLAFQFLVGVVRMVS